MIETGNGMTLVIGHDMLVMPGLVPGTHVFPSFKRQDVDGRNKSGHDERGR
jgi:hypothetical protein